MNFSSFKLMIASLALSSLAFAGCAADATDLSDDETTDEEEVGTSEAELKLPKNKNPYIECDGQGQENGVWVYKNAAKQTYDVYYDDNLWTEGKMTSRWLGLKATVDTANKLSIKGGTTQFDFNAGNDSGTLQFVKNGKVKKIQFPKQGQGDCFRR